MQEITNFNNKSNRLINEIKKDLTELVETQNIKHQNLQKLKLTINELQEEITQLENSQKKRKLPKINNNKDEEQIIKRKIIISNEKKSQSFSKWLINNNEL